MCLISAYLHVFSTHHATLAIKQVAHPHTGQVIAKLVMKCLAEWEVTKEKVLLVVSDNGANMKKAVKIMQEVLQAHEDENDENNEESNVEVQDQDNDSEEDDDHSGSEDEEVGSEHEENKEYFVAENEMPFRHRPCVSHTIQLLIKPVCNKYYNTIITSTRRLVSSIRTSSVMSQALIKVCGKTVIGDCPISWNSLFDMLERLLLLRPHVEEVLARNKHDSLRNTEWDKLQELLSLLQPFAAQTDILQTDGRSLSLIVPAVLELEAHLQAFPAKTAAISMLLDCRERFAAFFQPEREKFNPLPAAATLLDPTVAGTNEVINCIQHYYGVKCMK